MFHSSAILEEGDTRGYNRSGCAWLGQDLQLTQGAGQMCRCPVGAGRREQPCCGGCGASPSEALSGARDSVAQRTPLVLLSTAMIVRSAAFLALIAEP